jgi:cyclic di-GMP phosphodiesterase
MPDPASLGSVVIADDDESIREIVSVTLGDEGFQMLQAKDGAEALRMVSELDPSLLILDVMMPEIDGFEVMEELRGSERFRTLPVIMLSALGDDENIWRGWRSGISWYLTKPFEPDDLASTVHRLLGTTSQRIVGQADSQGPEPIHWQGETHQPDPVVEALLACVKARSPLIAERSERVARMAFDLSRSLKFFPPRVPPPLWIVLFDIGYIGVPDTVLGARRPLSAEEIKVVQGHTSLGTAILARHPDLAAAAEVAGTHHERFDGTGYPLRLAGDEIPLFARVVAVVDAFDAMTHDRPYRQALSPPQAVQRLREGAGTQFDPDIVDVLES